jgi:hypothetical protein
MPARRFARHAVVVAGLLAAPAAFSAYRASLEHLLPPQGLERVAIPGLGLAYSRPGALARYDRVVLDPVDVEFRRDWNPYRTGSALRLSTADREGLRAEVAGLVRDAFAQTLQRRGVHLADAPGPGVLRVRLHVVDLYLNDPGVSSAGRSRVFTLSSGEITLVGELADAPSGEVLARVADWQDMRHIDHVLLRSSNIRTQADVDGAASGWAASLAGAMGRDGRIGQ